MKGNCDYKPPGFIEYGKTGAGQILFNIERNDREIDGVSIENWDFEFVEVGNSDRSSVISTIIRSKYSIDEVEAMTANFLIGKDILDYNEYQEFRIFAKVIADGQILKSEVAEINFTDRLTNISKC